MPIKWPFKPYFGTPEYKAMDESTRKELLNRRTWYWYNKL